ncbi:MAG: PAS domain-containing protein, partial [Leptospiraceae bacterium]|nr:PAS domain-containing protein [Leptospiraceae bacterium]
MKSNDTSLIDALDDPVAIVDATGGIQATNQAFDEHANQLQLSQTPGPGTNYLDICRCYLPKSNACRLCIQGLTDLFGGRRSVYQHFHCIQNGRKRLRASRIDKTDRFLIHLREGLTYQNLRRDSTLEFENSKTAATGSMATQRFDLPEWFTDTVPVATFQLHVFSNGNSIFKGFSSYADVLPGLYARDLIGRDIGRFLERVGPEDRDRVARTFREACEQRKAWEVRFRIDSHLDHLRYLQLRASPLEAVGGGLFWNGIMLDISESRDLQLQLADVAQLARVGNWELNPIGNRVNHNEEISRIIFPRSLQRMEMLDQLLQSFVAEDRDILAENIQKLLTYPGSFDLELRVRTDHNEIAIVHIHARTECVNDQTMRLRGTMQDVTAITRQRQQIADLQYALDVSALVSATDRNGNITYANDNYTRVTGFTRDELIGQNPGLMNSGFHPPEFFQNLWETITRGQVWRGEIKNLNKDGELYWTDTVIVPFLDENNMPYQYMVIRYDITDRKTAEEKLKEARDMADEMNRLKSNFLANMSHEIRTPLNGIMGLAQIMRMEENVSKLHDYANLQLQSGRRLLETLTSILELSRLESHQTQLTLQRVDLTALVREVISYLEPIARSKSLRLSFESTQPDGYVHADDRLLVQVFNNIIGNALKFTDSGGVDISVEPAS